MPTKQDCEPVEFVKACLLQANPPYPRPLLPRSDVSDLYLSFFIRASKTTSLNPELAPQTGYQMSTVLHTHARVHTIHCETQPCVMCLQPGIPPQESSASQADGQH